MEEKIKVYIKIDNNYNVIEINSEIFIKNFSNWILVDSGYGDKYAHAQSQYLDLPLKDENGSYNYVYNFQAGKIIRR